MWTARDGDHVVVDVHHALPRLRVPVGADAPAWVRATSALVPWQGGWIAIQDDAAWLARLPWDASDAEGLALPTGDDGRRVFEARLGNKHHKADTEAAFVWDGVLYVLGSGSAGGRDRWAALSQDGSVSGGQWSLGYDDLRRRTAFAGAWLNLEGACVVGETLWLANRGNGGGRSAAGAVDGLLAVDAAGFVAAMREGLAPPEASACVQVAVPAVNGVRRTLTDLAAGPGGVWTLWSAEDSPNAVDDGEVLGSWLGSPTEEGWILHALVDADGAPLRVKAEGLAIVGARAYFVTDADDVDAPSTWLSLALPPVADPTSLERLGRPVT
jgi:hypothetical protein